MQQFRRRPPAAALRSCPHDVDMWTGVTEQLADHQVADEMLCTAVAHLVARCRTCLLDLRAARREIGDLEDPRAAHVLTALDGIVGQSSAPGALDVAERAASDLVRRLREQAARASSADGGRSHG